MFVFFVSHWIVAFPCTLAPSRRLTLTIFTKSSTQSMPEANLRCIIYTVLGFSNPNKA